MALQFRGWIYDGYFIVKVQNLQCLEPHGKKHTISGKQVSKYQGPRVWRGAWVPCVAQLLPRFLTNNNKSLISQGEQCGDARWTYWCWSPLVTFLLLEMTSNYTTYVPTTETSLSWESIRACLNPASQWENHHHYFSNGPLTKPSWNATVEPVPWQDPIHILLTT